jgi:hypothetical protein
MLDVDGWTKASEELTPVEKIGGLFFKREDYFAPLGIGGINGSKVRQCFHLIREYSETAEPSGILTAASLKSPQHSAVGAIAAAFNLPSVHIIGSTNPASALKHENIAIAAAFGARFIIIPVAYNPALQSEAKRLNEDNIRLRKYLLLEYGISIDHLSNPPERIAWFHSIGAKQCANLPENMDTLIIPAGSCNSTCSILYGIARNRPKALRDVYLFGIGPNRLEYLERRLRAIEDGSGVTIRSLFRREYVHNPDLSKPLLRGTRNAAITLHHYDLHGTGFVSYQEEMKAEYSGLTLHPTYEGKVMTYLRSVPNWLKSFEDRNSLFWIVGGKPLRANMPDVSGVNPEFKEFR